MNNSRALSNETILNNKYKIEGMLGEGGFGITYLAHDLIIDEWVAIKEYFPSTLGTRDTSDGVTKCVTVISQQEEKNYSKGLERFEEEAANLAKFNKEKGIVSVKNFFLENNTGYMVMEYIKGITLSEFLKQYGGKISYKRALEMMTPVMNSLSKVHAAGIIHRDISPDNIMIMADGTMKLIDFGAARYMDNGERSMTVMLKAGYAPIEQYSTMGTQGTWTDIYAICATLYRMISGRVPAESVARYAGDERLPKLKQLCPKVTDPINNAVMRGLEVDAKNRIQSIDELLAAINMKDRSSKKRIFVGVAVGLTVVALGMFLPGFIKKLLASKASKDDTAEKITRDDLNENYEKDGNLSGNEGKHENDVANKYENEADSEYFIAINEAFLQTPTGRNLIRSSGFEEVRLPKFEKFISSGYDGKYTKLKNIESFYYKESQDNKGLYLEYSDDVYVLSSSLVTEAEYETVQSYLQIIEEQYSIIIDRESWSGVFDDFNGDGRKGLFISVYTLSDDGSDSYKNSLYYSDGFVCFDKAGNENLSGREKWNVSEMGRYKVVSFCAESDTDSEYLAKQFYLVDSDEIKLIDLSEVSDDLGWMSYNPDYVTHSTYEYYESGSHDRYIDGYCELYNPSGEAYSVLCVDSRTSYPIVYFNGEFGEYASVEIENDEFMSLNGVDKIQSEIFSILSARDKLIISDDCWIDSEGEITIDYRRNMIDQILYNDMGFFVVNCIVDWNFSTSGPWVIDDSGYWVDTFGGDIIDGKLADKYFLKREFDIDKTSAHFFVSYTDGELKIKSWGFSRIKDYSGALDVFMESDFSSFPGLN